VRDFGLDPETALQLIQILLRVCAYFFAGFAVLTVSTYIVLLCLEAFSSQPRRKSRIAKIRGAPHEETLSYGHDGHAGAGRAVSCPRVAANSAAADAGARGPAARLPRWHVED